MVVMVGKSYLMMRETQINFLAALRRKFECDIHFLHFSGYTQLFQGNGRHAAQNFYSVSAEREQFLALVELIHSYG
jgi:hypothetical protein